MTSTAVARGEGGEGGGGGAPPPAPGGDKGAQLGPGQGAGPRGAHPFPHQRICGGNGGLLGHNIGVFILE